MNTFAKISHYVNVFNLFMKTTAGITISLFVVFVPQMAGTTLFANSFFSSRLSGVGLSSHAASGASWTFAILFGVIVEYCIYFFAIQKKHKVSYTVAVVSVVMAFLGWTSGYIALDAMESRHLFAICIISALPPFFIAYMSKMLAANYDQQHVIVGEIEGMSKNLIVSNYRKVVGDMTKPSVPNNKGQGNGQGKPQRTHELTVERGYGAPKPASVNMYGSNI